MRSWNVNFGGICWLLFLPCIWIYTHKHTHTKLNLNYQSLQILFMIMKYPQWHILSHLMKMETKATISFIHLIHSISCSLFIWIRRRCVFDSSVRFSCSGHKFHLPSTHSYHFICNEFIFETRWLSLRRWCDWIRLVNVET